MNKILSLIIVAVFAVSFMACEEELGTAIGTPTDEDMQPIIDNVQAENGLMTATSYMNPYGLDEDLSTKDNSDPDYTLNGNVLTIDFSAVSGMGGVIIVEYDSNPLAIPLNAISAVGTLQNFMIDSVVYNGVVDFDYTKENDIITFAVETKENTPLTIVCGEKQTIWRGNRTLTWVQGIDTPDSADDLYEVTGSAEGVSSTSSNFTTEILSALVTSPACEYVMAGEQKLINRVGENDETTITMNYSVDSNGDELTEPTCNPYVKLHFESSLLDVNMVINLDDF